MRSDFSSKGVDKSTSPGSIYIYYVDAVHIYVEHSRMLIGA